MEINELKYFLAVAEVESVQRGSRNLSVSPGSLSKAIGRLEAELGVKLFQRVGRNIRLTSEGLHLTHKAREIIKLEESVRESILGTSTAMKVKIGGSEALLANQGVQLARDLRDKYPAIKIHFEVCDRCELIARVRDRDLDIGITTFEVPRVFAVKEHEKIEFSTYLSTAHPLHEACLAAPISVHDVLKYPFVIPSGYSMGKIASGNSADGWRDDVYPRSIKYETASLKVIEELVLSGQAIGYLPDVYDEVTGFRAIDIHDCPYSNIQSVKIFSKDSQDYSWKSIIF